LTSIPVNLVSNKLIVLRNDSKKQMIKAKIFYQKKITFKKNDRVVRKLLTHAPIAESRVRVKKFQ